MTEYGIHYPAHMTGAQLDLFLAKGWYRMGQGIFTTNYVIQEESFFRVFWLRYNLARMKYGKTAQAIGRRNALFTTVIKRLQIDAELEDLYMDYKSGLTFEPASSVTTWLLDHQSDTIYDTRIVEVRHEGKLVAAGIFDMGETSIAGILNCYDPAYKKYSLGKYLILKKIEFAMDQHMQWYYPGYIVKDYPRFDYKLFADSQAAELYLPEHDAWFAYNRSLMENPAI